MRDVVIISAVFCATLVASAFAVGPQGFHAAVAAKNAGGGSSFSPTDVSGLVAWYTADAGILEAVSDPAEDGDAVAIIEDQSSSGNDITASNTTYRASRSGMPALDLADSENHWELASAIEDNGASIFVVVETSDTVWGVAHETGTGGTFLGVSQDGNSSSPHNAGTDLAGTEYYVDGVQVSPQDRNTLYDDGQAAGTNFIISIIDVDLRDWSTGMRLFSYTSSGLAFVGYVREVLIYDNAVSASDQSDIEDYLGRWP